MIAALFCVIANSILFHNREYKKHQTTVFLHVSDIYVDTILVQNEVHHLVGSSRDSCGL